MSRHTVHHVVAIIALAASAPASSGGSSPWAAQVIDYNAGANNPGLTDPQVALGEPSRFTGKPVFPAVVSPFNPPWTDSDIVSVGGGGFLVIQFDQPVVDHPDNPFGIDLIIFGNTGFIDANWPAAVVGGVFSNDGGIVEVSADGEHWELVPDAMADTLFPTLGYLDSGAYDTDPGRVLSNFTRPVDPELTMDDFLGLGHEDVVALYNGSGGGSGIDIASTGLSKISYVRISHPDGAPGSVEIDAFARVSPLLTGDLNLDGLVNVLDLLILFDGWGPVMPDTHPADLNDDSIIDVLDLLIVLENWSS